MNSFFGGCFILSCLLSPCALNSQEEFFQGALDEKYETKRENGLLVAERIEFPDGSRERRFFTYDEKRRVTSILKDDGIYFNKEDLSGVTWRKEEDFFYFSEPSHQNIPWPEITIFQHSFDHNPLEIYEIRKNICSPIDHSIQLTEVYNSQHHLIATIPGHLVEKLPPPSKNLTDPLQTGWKYVFGYFSQLKQEAHYANELSLIWDDTLRQFLGSSFLFLAGFYADRVMTGSIGTHNLKNHIRITGINGILNSSGECIEWMREISESHNYSKVYYVYFASEGWTEDLHKCILAKNGVCFEAARALATLWKSLIKEIKEEEETPLILHYAHSLGGAHTEAARNLLTPEERSYIQIVTLGSPSLLHKREATRVINYVDKQDPIALFDPLRYIEAAFSEESNIIFIGNSGPPSLNKHRLINPYYYEVIEKEGQRRVEELLKNPQF